MLGHGRYRRRGDPPLSIPVVHPRSYERQTRRDVASRVGRSVRHRSRRQTPRRPTVIIFEFDPRFGPQTSLAAPWLTNNHNYDCAVPKPGLYKGSDCKVCNVLCMPKVRT